MSKYDIKNVEGQAAGQADLSDDVFGIEPNIPVIHQVVVCQDACLRQGTHSTKNRHEVSGGGRKPWRQKGTGRARQGSTRAPQWTHGGVALGPKPRDYRTDMNKKTKRVALFSALSSKVAAGELVVVDAIKTEDYSTKTMAAMLNALGADKKALVVLPEINATVIKSCANIPGVKTTQYNTLNVYDVLNADKFIIAKEAVAKLEEVYA